MPICAVASFMTPAPPKDMPVAFANESHGLAPAASTPGVGARGAAYGVPVAAYGSCVEYGAWYGFTGGSLHAAEDWYMSMDGATLAAEWDRCSGGVYDTGTEAASTGVGARGAGDWMRW